MELGGLAPEKEPQRYGRNARNSGSAPAPALQGTPLQPAPQQPGPPVQLRDVNAAPPPANPALQPQQAAPAEVDGSISEGVAKETEEAIKTAPDKEKENINKELEKIGGKGSVEKQYKKMLAEIGGEKEYDPKLDKKDWGLFLLDFGMRMMAASSKWNSQTLGSMGEAGSGALGALQGRQATDKASVEEFNKQQRSEARDLTGMEMDRQGALADPKNLIWDERGAFTRQPDGSYAPALDQGGTQLKPGMEPGANNRELNVKVRESMYLAAGFPPDVAARVAGGSPDPAELQFEFGKIFDKMIANPGTRDVFEGTDLKVRGAKSHQIMAARKKYVDERVASIYAQINQQPALADDGTQKDPKVGRPRPDSFGKF